MGWMEQEDLVFVISDNGVGIPPEILSTILSGTRQTDTGNNIAIYNTHKRLQVYFGSDYGLTYRSKLGNETEVEIRIPARQFDQAK